MPLMFSRACEYALQATIYLAAQPANTSLRVGDISEALSIPPHFLGKVLQSLARHQIVLSYKGKAGGFFLARPPEKITPYDVIAAIDGPMFFDHCLFGFPQCGDWTPCPAHAQWNAAKKIITQMLKNKSIAELSKEVDAKLDFDRRAYKVRDKGKKSKAVRALRVLQLSQIPKLHRKK